MALVDNRAQRTFILCALYFAQGVPWGFMLITLPTYLAYHYGIVDDQIGQLKAWILVPWTFKLIWAPIMDTFTIRSMGRRRPWIIGAELMMAITLFGFVGMDDLSSNMRMIVYMYFLHNCFASLQDVCTDALAIDILPPNEQGQMNGLMWVSKLVGRGCGAWALSLVINKYGLGACVAVQVVLLMAIMAIPIILLERPGEKRFPWSRGQASTAESSVRNPLDILLSYVRAFSLTTTLVYVIFALTKIIGYGVYEVISNTLYTQKLNPRWTDIEFSTASGLYSMFPIIIGAVLGGFLADRFGRRLILVIGYGGFSLMAILFASCPNMWNVGWFSMAYILLSESLNAIGAVGFLSMAMRISWTKAAATVFTTFMTLSNISHIVGNWAAGPIRRLFTFTEYGSSADMVSYELTFWFVGISTVLPLILLIFVSPAQVDRARPLKS